jgi:hypothetical protein
MRRGILGSIVALVTGAGAAWGQAPMPIGTAGGVPPAVMAGDVMQASGPAPVLMPPLSVGSPSDPMGLGPTAGLGPPPGPMYPMPGPYGAPLFQPAPPDPNGAGGYGGVNRWEFTGAYNLWFGKSQPAGFPLLTTSAPSQAGIPGASSTLVLAGGSPIVYNGISGMQLTGSFFGDDDRRFGALVTGFYSENRTISTKIIPPDISGSGGPADIPVLARPFFDTTSAALTSLVVGGPGLGNASGIVTTSTQTWGVEASAVWNLFRTAPTDKWYVSTDLVIGYKFLELNENLAVITDTNVNAVTVTPVFAIGPGGFPVQIGTTLTPITVPVAGTTVTSPGAILITDRFTTQNLFNGTTVGFRNEIRYGMFSLDTIAKIGLGDMQQILQVSGTTTTVSGTGAVGSAYGGLLANASNIGRFTHNDFAVIPEIQLNLGVNLTHSLSAFIGYNFMYMNNVIRPGTQLSPVVDSTSVPLSANYGAGGSVPAVHPNFVLTNYWLQGANFGLSFKY